MRRLPHLAAAVLFAVLLGCGGGAKEMLDTAQLEETQNNVPHARELYEAIIHRWPNTPEAATAAERLQALGDAGSGPAR